MGYQSSDLKFKCLNDYQIELDIVKRPRTRKWVRVIEGQGVDLSKIVDTGFKVLPKRWIVERTFAWINRYRRLSKEYEYLPTNWRANTEDPRKNKMMKISGGWHC
jgi:hypothetical protein